MRRTLDPAPAATHVTWRAPCSASRPRATRRATWRPRSARHRSASRS